ncbi:MAG: DMT family transporter [Desulfuromonadia bacterium]
MTLMAFTLIVISAVMHALWNLLVKKSREKTVFIWWMFVASGTLFTLTLILLRVPITLPDGVTTLSIAGGSVCFVLYHLFNGRAYREGDLSLIYPLSQSSMIYVPIWGVLILRERLSLTGVCGIFLVILGAMSVQMRRLSLSELLRPFRNLNLPPVRYALSAGFVYSFGSLTEKIGVSRYSPLLFTFFIVIVMWSLMTANLLRGKYRPLILEEARRNWRLILLSGPVMMSSFLSFRYGLSMAPMSYAVPVRQVSILIGVLIGILFLGESFGRARITGAAMIVAGAALIKLG